MSTTRGLATLGTDGLLTSAQRAAGFTIVKGEQFTGNAVLTAFVLAHTPLYGVAVYLAGVRVDVTLATATITFGVAPALAATIRVDYEY